MPELSEMGHETFLSFIQNASLSYVDKMWAMLLEDFVYEESSSVMVDFLRYINSHAVEINK